MCEVCLPAEAFLTAETRPNAFSRGLGEGSSEGGRFENGRKIIKHAREKKHVFRVKRRISLFFLLCRFPEKMWAML